MPRRSARSSSTAAEVWDERRAIIGLQPKRADVILAGVCIVKTVMDKLQKDKLSVSDRGLRHGLLIDRFSAEGTCRTSRVQFNMALGEWGTSCPAIHRLLVIFLVAHLLRVGYINKSPRSRSYLLPRGRSHGTAANAPTGGSPATRFPGSYKRFQVLNLRLEGENIVTRRRTGEVARTVILLLIELTLSGTALFAQNLKVQGIIKGRSGATMILQTSDSPKLVVLLTEATKVQQVQGMLKARRNRCRWRRLFLDLPVQVEGAYNEQNELVATLRNLQGQRSGAGAVHPGRPARNSGTD